jgi:hypothetical protein
MVYVTETAIEFFENLAKFGRKTIYKRHDLRRDLRVFFMDFSSETEMFRVTRRKIKLDTNVSGSVLPPHGGLSYLANGNNIVTDNAVLVRLRVDAQPGGTCTAKLTKREPRMVHAESFTKPSKLDVLTRPKIERTRVREVEENRLPD